MFTLYDNIICSSVTYCNWCWINFLQLLNGTDQLFAFKSMTNFEKLLFITVSSVVFKKQFSESYVQNIETSDFQIKNSVV